MLPNAGRHTVVGFGNRTGNRSKCIAVAADGYGISYGILEVGRFKECLSCLWNGILTGLIKPIGLTNAVEGKA